MATAPLTSSIWYAAKPGEERRFASVIPYNPDFAKSLRADGYKIFRINFELPDGWDSADFVVKAKEVKDA